MNDFAKRLKSLRTKRGFSASETARNAQVPITTYRDWEEGREIQGQPYLKLATALDVSLYELMTGHCPKVEVRKNLEQIEASLKRIKVSLD
jgi:transcriptional regulator with XRE-family HTH domain